MSTNARMEQFTSSDLNFAASIYSYSLHAAECLGCPKDWEFKAQIYDSYNGLARPYLLALSRVLLDRMRRGEVVGVNDSYDLDHFAYLEPAVTLVTNDKRMAALGRTVGIRTMNSVELR
jgi:hypothetical protein